MQDRIAFITEFRTIARRKGTTPEDLFHDWDPDEIGKIKYELFRKILSSINMWVSEARIATLVQPYLQEQDFLYADFMNVDGVTETARVGATDDDVAEFGRQLQSRCIFLQDTMEECDRHHCGHVSVNHFLRTFGSTPLTKKICERFRNGENEVEYLQLDREIKRIQHEQATRPPTQIGFNKELPLYFNQVAYDINAQSVDPLSTFLGLDKFKRGTLPKKVFLNALYSFNLRINATQLVQLVEAFADNNDQVPYRVFCDEIQKAIVNQPPSTKSTFSTKGSIDVTLAYLRDVEKNRHSQIGEKLRILDPRDTGLINSARFFKTLNAEKFKIGQTDVDVLEQEYSDGNGNIEYRRFLADILPPTVQMVPTASQIIDRLRTYLADRQLRLKPRLVRYDRDRSGQIAIRDLAHALHSISFDFTTKEWTMLMTSLGPNAASLFDYAAFCDTIDPVLPEPVVPEPVETRREPEVRERPPEDILNILVSIVESAKRQKVGIYEEFRARDSLHQGTVPTSQFQSLVLRFNPSLSQRDVATLTEFYRDQPFRTNYENMCKDISNHAKQVYHESQRLASSAPNGPRPETLEVLRRLKSHLDYQRISPEEVFFRYDSSRSGYVMKNRLGAILEATNFETSRLEQQFLEEDFQDRRRPELLNYKLLFRFVNELQLTVNDLSSIRITSQVSNVPDRQVAILVNSLRERIQERHKRVRDPFSGCTPGEPIPAREFRQAVASFGLIIREVDYLTLLRAYRFNRQGDVDWEKFCHDVETSRTVEMV